MKDYLIGDDGQESDIDLRFEIGRVTEPTDQQDYFLGIISLYGLGHSPSNCGYILEADYEAGKQMDSKEYRVYSEFCDRKLLKKLAESILWDIDLTWITSGTQS